MTSAVEIATVLRDDPTVVGIVGDAESGRTLDAIPVLEDLEHRGARAVVAVSPTATSPALSGRSPWVFRVTPSDAAVSQAAAAYLADSLGARRAAVVYRNDSYGRDWTTAFLSAFRARGGTVVQRDPYVAGITEWAALAAYTRRSGADAVLFPGQRRGRGGLRARPAGRGGDRARSSAATPSRPSLARGVRRRRFATPVRRRARSAHRRPRPPSWPRTRARWHEAPSARAALAYDAATVIGRAVIAVGRDRTRIRDWVARVGTEVPAIPGAAGPIAFDAKHDARDRSVTIVTVAAKPAPSTGAGR